MQVKDQLNRSLTFTNSPKRIVSLVPSITEMLVYLGLEDHIVGVTKFCVNPPDLRKSKIIVGGTKTVSTKIVDKLEPDIIIANKEENSLQTIEQLSTTAPIYISNIKNLSDCYQLIEHCGLIFNVEPRANQLVTDLRNEELRFKAFSVDKRKLRVAYFIWKDPWMVAASGTFIDYMLRLNYFNNCFSKLERYPEVDLEEIKEMEIDVILLSSEPFPFKEKHINYLKELLPNVEILLVDGEMFSWYGSRMLEAFPYFRKLRTRLNKLS